MNATRHAPGRPDAPPSWPARLGSLLLSALMGLGVLAITGGQASAAPRLDDGMNYWITNLDSGHLLDNANESIQPENPIIQWPRHYRDNQQWFFEREDAPDTYRIRNRHSGLCLKALTSTVTVFQYDPKTGESYVAERHVEPTGAVVQSKCRDNIEGSTPGTYRWFLRDAGDGTYEIEPTGLTERSSYRLASQDLTAGSEVRIFDAGSSGTRWTVDKVRYPYSFETAYKAVPPWQLVSIDAQCAEGWRVEILPNTADQPHYDYIGHPELDVHEAWVPEEWLNYKPRSIVVTFGNPTWSTLEAKIRVYCVPSP